MTRVVPIGVTSDGTLVAADDGSQAAIAQLERWRAAGFYPTLYPNPNGWALVLATEQEWERDPSPERGASRQFLKYTTPVMPTVVEAVKAAQEVIK